jgi:DNA-binding PadR family transcriptional regulator
MTSPEPPGGNEIADAINKISGAFGSPAEGANSQPARQPEGQPPDIPFAEAATPTQRRVLGCIACQLKGIQASPDGAFAGRIEECTGASPGTVTGILKQLAAAKTLIMQQKNRTGAKGHPRLYYRPADSPTGAGLLAELQAPESCGLEQTRVMPNKEAEDYLREKEIFGLPSEARRVILGCLACQLGGASPGEKRVKLNTITTCRRTSDNNVMALRMLTALTRAGILEVRSEKSRGGRPPNSYAFTFSTEASALRHLLETPNQCGLEQTQDEEQPPAQSDTVDT